MPKHAPRKKERAKRGFFRRFWWAFLLVPFLMVAVVAISFVVAYQRIQLPDTLPPIRTSYLLDRDGQPARLPARRGGPHHRPAHPDLTEPAARGDRHRGRGLLRPPGYRREGHHSCGLDRPGEEGHRAGRLDAHRAAREERVRRAVRPQRRRHHRLRRPAAHDQGEDPRGVARDQAGAELHQGPDPREVPEHRVLRPRRIRRRGRRPDVLREAGERAHRPRVGLAGRRAARAHALRPHRQSLRQQVPSRLLPRSDGHATGTSTRRGPRSSRRRSAAAR